MTADHARPTRGNLLHLVAPALALLIPSMAAAQDGGRSFQHSGFQPPVSGGGVVRDNRLPPPPALPGAASSQTPAPPQRLPLDLPPTDALFDAIDRGDIGAAREALARGADLNAANVLGMTPIEMSIDLGHSDITFLLLSLRGATPAGRAATVGTVPAAGAKPAGGKDGGARVADSKTAARTVASVTAESRRPPPAADAAPPRVRYAATVPGSDPQAGFLGFGRAADASAQP